MWPKCALTQLILHSKLSLFILFLLSVLFTLKLSFDSLLLSSFTPPRTYSHVLNRAVEQPTLLEQDFAYIQFSSLINLLNLYYSFPPHKCHIGLSFIYAVLCGRLHLYSSAQLERIAHLGKWIKQIYAPNSTFTSRHVVVLLSSLLLLAQPQPLQNHSADHEAARTHPCRRRDAQHGHRRQGHHAMERPTQGDAILCPRDDSRATNSK